MAIFSTLSSFASTITINEYSGNVKYALILSTLYISDILTWLGDLGFLNNGKLLKSI